MSNHPSRFCPSEKRSNPNFTSSSSSALRISFCFLDILLSRRSHFRPSVFIVVKFFRLALFKLKLWFVAARVVTKAPTLLVYFPALSLLLFVWRLKKSYVYALLNFIFLLFFIWESNKYSLLLIQKKNIIIMNFILI